MSILAIIVLVITVLALGFVAGLITSDTMNARMERAAQKVEGNVYQRAIDEERIARLELAGRTLALSYDEVRDADCGCADARSLAAGYACPVGHAF